MPANPRFMGLIMTRVTIVTSKKMANLAKNINPIKIQLTLEKLISTSEIKISAGKAMIL